MILITGGSGFIGTNLINGLLRRGITQIISVDIVSPKNKSHQHLFKKIDILDFDNIESIFIANKIDCIIHLAARTDINGLLPSDYIVNTVGTENVVQLAIKYNVQRCIYASSMLVQLPGFSQSMSYNPYNNQYAFSKVESEKIINRYYENAKSLEYFIVRPTSIWGPYMGSHYFDFFKAIKKNRYFHIKGINPKKSYGYVENIVSQIILLFECEYSTFQSYVIYLRDPWDYSIVDWSNLIADHFNVRILNLPFWLIKSASLLGDIFKRLGFKFPLNSYRLNNLTTHNIVPFQSQFYQIEYLDLKKCVSRTINFYDDKF